MDIELTPNQSIANQRVGPGHKVYPIPDTQLKTSVSCPALPFPQSQGQSKFQAQEKRENGREVGRICVQLGASFLAPMQSKERQTVSFEAQNRLTNEFYRQIRGWGNNDAILNLLDKGANVNGMIHEGGVLKRAYFYTPLHLVAFRGGLSLVLLLLSYDVDLGSRVFKVPKEKSDLFDRLPVEGFTALHLVAVKGNSFSADVLLTNGASRDAKSLSKDGNGLTPVQVAWMYKRKAMFDTFIFRGAPFQQPDNYLKG